MATNNNIVISRINVVGTSASGKSTLAKAIAAKLGCAYVEMDALWFKEDWQNVSDEEFNAQVAEATKGDAWVLDGNYTRTVPIKWQRVQMVVWVDMPFYVTLYRAIKRALVRVVSKEPLWHGNRESWRKLLSKDSIVWWMIKTHKTNMLKYEAMMQDEQFKHIQFVRLRNTQDVESFLLGLS